MDLEKFREFLSRSKKVIPRYLVYFIYVCLILNGIVGLILKGEFIYLSSAAGWTVALLWFTELMDVREGRA
jgi:hypothetical protein